jgi:hypothetical protein
MKRWSRNRHSGMRIGASIRSEELREMKGTPFPHPEVSAGNELKQESKKGKQLKIVQRRKRARKCALQHTCNRESHYAYRQGPKYSAKWVLEASNWGKVNKRVHAITSTVNIVIRKPRKL